MQQPRSVVQQRDQSCSYGLPHQVSYLASLLVLSSYHSARACWGCWLFPGLHVSLVVHHHASSSAGMHVLSGHTQA